MRHVFFCFAERDVIWVSAVAMVKQVFHPVAHLARQQLVGFLSLLALGDIKEDAEHNSISYVSVIALASSGNPPNIAAGQNAKINLVSTHHCAGSRKC